MSTSPPASRRRPSGALLFAAWAAGTTVAVVFSVVAINLAGAGVSDQASMALTPARVDTALSIEAAPHHSDRKGAEEPTTTAAAGAPVSPPPDSTASVVPSRSGSSGASSGDPSTTIGKGPGSSSATEPRASTTTTVTPSSSKSASAQGGTVQVQCIGSTVTLVSATSKPGFETDAHASSGAQVVVYFARDIPPHSSQITATCSNGTIQFKVREIADS
jgi:hypothetical protein